MNRHYREKQKHKNTERDPLERKSERKELAKMVYTRDGKGMKNTEY